MLSCLDSVIASAIKALGSANSLGISGSAAPGPTLTQGQYSTEPWKVPWMAAAQEVMLVTLSVLDEMPTLPSACSSIPALNGDSLVKDGRCCASCALRREVASSAVPENRRRAQRCVESVWEGFAVGCSHRLWCAVRPDHYVAPPARCGGGQAQRGQRHPMHGTGTAQRSSSGSSSQ